MVTLRPALALPLSLILLLVLLLGAEAAINRRGGETFGDFRCKCICPSTVVVTNSTTTEGSDATRPERAVYIDNVSPHHCSCDWVVLPQLTPDVQDKAKEFCPRCECKYESRNTTTIRWVVTFIIGVIVCLIIYMGFLMLLDPLIHKGPRNLYQEHVNEELVLDEQVSEGTGPGGSRRIVDTPLGESSVKGANVLNRVNCRAEKWKKQVQEQRDNVYDKHSFLN